ncbi:DUF1289 domain-containing protein [Erythrobacter sp. HL-111]|uniref:DUF1289 domain-containing protein n=1 Tax=Erythrobacter sp. HL-111 TaxID=1798193 RepID=UPI00087C3A5A|nr:DUF1289 domain-containing protein [Erythrobacter sp. HL-111]SDS56190.1 hypothetical protein SAMN04515621_1793 [Erythrobacter sp. HL-111]
MVDPVPSPCRKICRLSQDGGLCVGCGRTLDEIAGWQAMTDAERDAASAAARTRLARLE